ncbi:MAG TPA: DISARM system phospholipase D-like protein DrmC [Polyangium sp.]|nr:DISARM system phospholipase D-like protein DrmC [Polyangium sp.]
MKRFDGWLEHATAADLAALAAAIREGRIPFPARASALQRAGFGEGATAFLEGLQATEPSIVVWMLERLSEERRRAEDRYARMVRLVWSGASEPTQGMRDTREVLEELFGKAERHVLISTYVIHQGASVFAALGKRMRECPGLEVELYVNLPAKPGSVADEKADVAAFRERFFREHWPKNTRMPALYYDPESHGQGSSRTSLHAKCVVVDGRWALITSANFTEAAQERNIEAGVLLDHVQVAESLVGRFRALRAAGRLRGM